VCNCAPVPALRPTQVSTNFSYKRIFSTKTAGGKREYCTALILDTSQSMSGYLEDCAVLSLVVMLTSLFESGVENVSLLLYNTKVRVIKLGSAAWDPSLMLLLLSNLHADLDSDLALGSCDADAILCALDLLAGDSGRGPKSVFVFTDGRTSCGVNLARALVRAEEAGVAVLGVCVGMEPSMVSSVYRRWMTVALPSALPDALRAFFEQELSGVPSPCASTGSTMPGTWVKPQLEGAAATTAEVLRLVSCRIKVNRVG
jgi:hypothetical protein